MNSELRRAAQYVVDCYGGHGRAMADAVARLEAALNDRDREGEMAGMVEEMSLFEACDVAVRARQRVEREVGLPFEEFLDGMRKLLEPAHIEVGRNRQVREGAS